MTGPKPTKTMATLIRRLPLTESSFIVHWCSDEFGLVKCVAKGARRPKSPFAGKLDLFYRCEIELVPARQGDLHILKDVAVSNSRLGIRKTYRQTLAASYFVRLLESVVEIESPIADLADLLERALNFLESNQPDAKAVRHFETQLAQMLGVAEEGGDPIDAIRDTFGKVPKQRDELLQLIERSA
ncbi:MAG: DNA repair protein RecO [Verrucomicrobiae bacterium]|nr:DNA repair protein RecO [Verrucomicrobiae bacterium]